ncbi:biotin transport system substrate-specific component [Thermosyntropha lipolytica DSM 11003]|uniref:Biotin transporter n=1 Tax=Thermosyntropha lipolytica DSM 11003 TaxID=1123382 RepID=A0A1M5JV93_9FIRM|nr:biotin transporter BioY [Thermosyntropha lipolytica]SHG44464.1 biotin transport system substrate-specific component [Thermosyntropha lipolytica DSM 11003]
MSLSTRELVLASLFTALMCVVTIIVRALQPVVVIPFSLQPLIMLLAACLLPPRGAFLSMLAYLCLGLMGIPVFSSPPYGGPGYVLMPSFGFLLAFPIAAYVQSRLIRKMSLPYFLGAGFIAVIILYLIGLPYMYLILNFYLGKAMDVMQILKIGFFPFITFDLLKIVVASLLALELSRRLDLKREFNNTEA